MIIVIIVVLSILCAFSLYVGFVFGAEISGTTIPGLKLSLLLTPALALGVVGVIVGFFFATTLIFGASLAAASIVGAGAARLWQRLKS